MNILIENRSISKKEILLNNIWEYAVNEQFAVAIWRLPKHTNLNFLADFSGKPTTQKIDFESNQTGFCISPFENNAGQISQLLKKDIFLEFSHKNELVEAENETIANKLFLEKAAKFIKNISRQKPQIIENKIGYILEKQDFEKKVTLAIENINEGRFQKVVLSREKKLTFEGHINIIALINKLAVAYPNAFISVVYLPFSKEIWIGASPETLVELDQNGVFKTMALAGTQSGYDALGQKIGPANARWSQKEIEEQAFVSRYIIDCFKKVRVREYIENGPKTVEAGNLLHLQTTYLVDTTAIDFSQFATVLLELLHPTSAVCGMPKAQTLAFILENENYKREFYSGFLGPINIKNCSNLFVNLRSLKIQGNNIHLFAGAGITEDSDPTREWQETEMKMQTLLKILND